MTLYREESIPLAIIGLLFLLSVLIFDKINQRPVGSRNARITKWLMFGVVASNALHQISWLAELLFCAHCEIQYSSWGVTKSILKGFNLMFLIHRGKLVQGITPVLSKKWFDKIFPAFIVVMISGFIFASINSAIGDEYECAPYDNWEGLSHCQRVRNPDPEADVEDNTALIACAIGFDSLITVFLMMLFIIPLYRVYTVDLGVMNSPQLKQRKKLKLLLIWSAALTFINQVTSILTMVEMFNQINFPYVMKMMGECDPAINVWTAWLMITRNRLYLKRFCCCSKKNSSRSMLRSNSMKYGLTNQLSRTSNINSTPSSIERISVDITTAVTGTNPKNTRVNSVS